MTSPNVTKLQKVTTQEAVGDRCEEKEKKRNGSSEGRASTPKTLSAIMST